MFTEELLMSSIYIAGVLSFFSPCIFPIVPVYLSILSNGGEKSIFKTLMFVLGLSVTFLVLGFGAGLIGEIFFDRRLRIIGGVIIILLGFFQMGLIKLKFLERTKSIDYQVKETSVFYPFILGLTFSLGWTPCIGPILASILFISGSSGDVIKSMSMMGMYLLGLATPFVIFSMASKVLFSKVSFLRKYLETLKKVGGLIIVLMGILLILDKLNIFLQI